MPITQNLKEYIKFCFNEESIEESSSIPHFPDSTGERSKEQINNDDMKGEIIKNTAFPNYKLYKLQIENILERQKSVIFKLSKMLIKRDITNISFYIQETNNPLAYYIYIMIVFND